MKQLSKLFILIGSITCLFVAFVFLTKLPVKIDFSSTIKSDVWGQFGDIIGGVVGTIFSLVGIFLLIETLRGGEKAQIESKIFELIKFHRENITEISNNFEGGRLLFKKITAEINTIYEKVNDCGCEMKKSKDFDGDFDDFSDIDQLNVAYLISFFGLDLEKNQALKTKVCSFTECSNLMEKSLSCIPKLRDNFENIDANYNIHIGYQFILGHYFRHLYQTISYIDSLKFFSYKEKYFYVKTLRAQLSTYEQILFYYNSVSSLGLVWELDVAEKELKKISNFFNSFFKNVPFLKNIVNRKFDIQNHNKKLITKYNIIKNIPQGLCKVEPSIVYPNVEFEGDEKSEEKKIIEKHYS